MGRKKRTSHKREIPITSQLMQSYRRGKNEPVEVTALRVVERLLEVLNTPKKQPAASLFNGAREDATHEDHVLATVWTKALKRGRKHAREEMVKITGKMCNMAAVFIKHRP